MESAGDDEEKIDKIMVSLQDINTNFLNKHCSEEGVDDPHRADKFVGPIPVEEPLILNPLSSRNKGVAPA